MAAGAAPRVNAGTGGRAAAVTLSEPDGRHAVAGVWRPFGIIVTCHGHWLIPAPGPQDLRPLRP